MKFKRSDIAIRAFFNPFDPEMVTWESTEMVTTQTYKNYVLILLQQFLFNNLCMMIHTFVDTNIK